MTAFRRTSAPLLAAALLLPVLAAQAPAHAQQSATPAGCAGLGTSPAPALLDVDYESGTPDSGIPGLTTTHASAPDASAVVQPGHLSGYAIQHRVTLDDPGYFSDGAPRSESATDLLPNGTFRPGDAQRYEFSVLLEDWQPYQAGDSASGDIFFQGKYGGGQPPAFYLMTKRNAVAFRSPQLNRQETVVADFRPYVNQWMDFRVDVRWATDSTGCFRVSARLPGQDAYQQVAAFDGVPTWQPSAPADHGYLKWGLYRPSESLLNGDVPTRTVRHDDIRILDLPS
ncbi:heparin lyase I family protein [Kitasatospora sp. YST-16]|uniref:heparin lyase I family protein n=1 Tax=unclassified Kitasatospora TaxID=2633591 RepID=UPI00055C6B95|nr:MULTISPECIES: heparin lyase I family protein [unclassified Kitasatospora]WAL74778.1 heparin lyase I family protein [Kitasatospora sp. YST-16]WNW40832.1 heparin lyase I family protein [Streptomyces sp. Li-HN-5-13]